MDDDAYVLPSRTSKNRSVKHRVYGKSSKSAAHVYVIAHIDDVYRGAFNIGQILRYEVFRDYPPFTITSTFTSGANPKKKVGFADPKSFWFNCVMGGSRVDMPISDEFDRPFGFTVRSEVCKIDILLFCKALMNYIVCYIYGVPITECINQTKLSGDEQVSVVAKSARGLENVYTEVEISDIVCTSGYRCKSELYLNSPEMTRTWQKALGKTKVRKYAQTAFPPVRMKIRLLLRYEKSFDPVVECPQYCTYIKFGMVQMRYDVGDVRGRLFDDFLNTQMSALKETGTLLHYATSHGVVL